MQVEEIALRLKEEGPDVRADEQHECVDKAQNDSEKD